MMILRAVQVDNDIRSRERAANIANLIKAPSATGSTGNTEEINIDEETGTNEKEDINLLAIEAASAALKGDSNSDEKEEKEMNDKEEEKEEEMTEEEKKRIEQRL